MPIYDYTCDTCGLTAEVTCKMSERDDLVPECKGHGPMTRQITNNQKHVDNTDTRKGYFNSKEGYHR